MRKLLATAAALLAVGCSATGENFSAIKKPSENNAMLYVYRPSQLYGGGLYYDVHIDKELMGTLKNGAFLEKELPAGTYEIWAETEAKRNIDVTLEPATVTCIRGGVTLGFMVGRPTFSPVPLNQCTEELAGTARPE